MRFRVRDLLVADVNQEGRYYPCAPGTVCGTITNNGPNGETCVDATHCCYTTCAGTIGKLQETPELADDFLNMLRHEISEMHPLAAPEPQRKEDLEALERRLSEALDHVRQRLASGT